MYKVSIFNNGVETVVHYPSSNQDDPHVSKLPLKDGLSVVDLLSFSLYANNQGYDKVFELSTKVKVIDVRDNSIRFTGRVLDISNKMDSNGIVYKEVSCEGALSFLNDTKLRGSSFYGNTITTFLNQILSIHNSKVESGKRIYVGTVNVVSSVLHTCEFKTTLAEIIAVREQIGGHIRIREVNSVLYLDWMQSFSSSLLEVSLGVNMKDMIINKDITSLGTRIIPIGANNLTIESVNGGLDYLEDTNAKNIYGVIEKIVEYKDIEDPYMLMATCLNELSIHTQPLYVLTSNALDLSYLTGNKAEQFYLGTRLHLLNRFMGVDAIYSIVELNLDLLTPYNPTLTISQKPVTLSNTINDLRKTSIQNNGVYNNVQIGSAYGIRAVRNDGKVVTTINATDGISIENNTKKVFYVDTNGNLVCVDITANNITAEGGIYNNITANNIAVNKGTFTDITADGGTFDDIQVINGITITDKDLSCIINELGISLSKGDYTSGMQVKSNSRGDGTAIEFDDDISVLRNLNVGNFSFFAEEAEFDGGIVINEGGYLTIGGKKIDSIIDTRIKNMVKADSLI